MYLDEKRLCFFPTEDEIVQHIYYVGRNRLYMPTVSEGLIITGKDELNNFKHDSYEVWSIQVADRRLYDGKKWWEVNGIEKHGNYNYKSTEDDVFEITEDEPAQVEFCNFFEARINNCDDIDYRKYIEDNIIELIPKPRNGIELKFGKDFKSVKVSFFEESWTTHYADTPTVFRMNASEIYKTRLACGKALHEYVGKLNYDSQKIAYEDTEETIQWVLGKFASEYHDAIIAAINATNYVPPLRLRVHNGKILYTEKLGEEWRTIFEVK